MVEKYLCDPAMDQVFFFHRAFAHVPPRRPQSGNYFPRFLGVFVSPGSSDRDSDVALTRDLVEHVHERLRTGVGRILVSLLLPLCKFLQKPAG